MSSDRIRVVVSVLIVLVVVGVLRARPGAPVPIPEASSPAREFTFAETAEAVVLYVSVRPAQRPGTKSMAVYGDGRIELRKIARTGGRIMASFDVQVDRAEVESLLRIAVDHDLVDWNPAAIRVRQERTGRPFTAGSDDASSIDVIIALENYGDRQGAGREIRGLHDLRIARMLNPEFLEYKGIEAIVRYMNNAFTNAAEHAP